MLWWDCQYWSNPPDLDGLIQSCLIARKVAQSEDRQEAIKKMEEWVKESGIGITPDGRASFIYVPEKATADLPASFNNGLLLQIAVGFASKLAKFSRNNPMYLANMGGGLIVQFDESREILDADDFRFTVAMLESFYKDLVPEERDLFRTNKIRIVCNSLALATAIWSGSLEGLRANRVKALAERFLAEAGFDSYTVTVSYSSYGGAPADLTPTDTHFEIMLSPQVEFPQLPILDDMVSWIQGKMDSRYHHILSVKMDELFSVATHQLAKAFPLDWKDNLKLKLAVAVGHNLLDLSVRVGEQRIAINLTGKLDRFQCFQIAQVMANLEKDRPHKFVVQVFEGKEAFQFDSSYRLCHRRLIIDEATEVFQF